MKYQLVYSSNPQKLAEILKENERLGIVIPVPKERRIKWFSNESPTIGKQPSLKF